MVRESKSELNFSTQRETSIFVLLVTNAVTVYITKMITSEFLDYQTYFTSPFESRTSFLNSVSASDITKILKMRLHHLGRLEFYKTWLLLRGVIMIPSLFCMPTANYYRET